MFEKLPDTAHEVMKWTWDDFAPYYADLEQRPLTANTVDRWLADWSKVNALIDEMSTRKEVATTLDTTDAEAEAAYKDFLDNIYPAFSTAEQALKERLLESGLEPDNFEIPLRNMRAEAEIFRAENIPLLNQISKLSLEYDRISGAQTIVWDGAEITLVQAYALLDSLERDKCEEVWQLIATRHLEDRQPLNELWAKMLEIRVQIATNAGFESFRDYQWRSFARFDYTPQDCETFHAAIEEVVVPAATQVYERHRQLLNAGSLRPWDMSRDNVYPPARPHVHAFDTVEELEGHAQTIFNRVDAQLGEYFSTMRRENLLDLDNRRGKGPGGYCTTFNVARRPFIFMNAVGSGDDVTTLLHEAGHAFHAFEETQLPLMQQRTAPIEFAEVASMAMELLSSPYWAASEGGYYSDEDTVHARRQHLEHILLFWPYMAVVDAFQHWVYAHPDEALNTANCDAKWSELIDRFIPGIDWSGLEDMKMTGWHRKLHIFQIPFYYVDYGLAQLGAVQVWRNALNNQALAVENYRKALALGGVAALPDLFSTAGARFGFDATIMREAVDLIQATLAELDAS